MYAHFRILVDGVEIGQSFTTSDYTPYLFDVTSSSSIEEVLLVFDNDAVIDGADRNLYVQSIELDGLMIPAPGDYVTYYCMFVKADNTNGTMRWSGDLVFDLSGTNGSSARLALTGIFDKYQVVDDDLKMFIYPNPADRQITIELRNATLGSATLVLHDFSGRKVRSYDLAVTGEYVIKTLDTSEYRDGLYVLKLITEDNQSIFQKLIIDK